MFRVLNATLGAIIVLRVLIHASEPKCSNFDFVEQLLEKVIRMEINFKMMQDDMTTMRESVNRGLAALTEDRETVKRDVSELMINQTVEFSDKTKSMEETSKQLHAVITRMSEDLRTLENQTVQKMNNKTTIAFNAKMSRSTRISTGQTLVFPEIKFNDLNGYDGNTGKFTAPVKGVYLLTMQICPRHKNAVVLNIVVNGKPHNTARVGDTTYDMCYSISDIIHLDQGMEAWITFTNPQSSPIYVEPDSIYYQNFFADQLQTRAVNNDELYTVTNFNKTTTTATGSNTK